MWFGAKGDGTTDDTASIRAAIATGRDVLFPKPTSFYSITNEIGPKSVGQTLFAHVRIRGMIRNVTNSNRLAVFGDISSNSGAVPQAGMINLGFRGNAATIGGIWLPSNQSPGGNASWTDASKDCQVIGCAVDNVGAGFALTVHSWSNEIKNFTAYEDNAKGLEVGVDANANNFDGIYLTDCDGVSIHITDVGTGRISRNISFTNTVVQQSGGDATRNACIAISKAANVVFNGLYLEGNNAKGATRSLYADNTVTALVVNGVNHLSGGAAVLSLDAIGFFVAGVTSTGVSGNIIEVISTGASGFIAAVKVEVGFTSSGGLVGGAGFQGSNVTWLQDRTFFNDFTVSSFNPTINMIDQSGGVANFRVRADAGTLRLQSDNAGGTTFATEGIRLTPSVPEGVVNGVWRPDSDNDRTLGTAVRRWSVVYAGTGSINTSDENEKREIEAILDAVLDAWGAVEWYQFKFDGRVRTHIGLVAQRVKTVFEAHGLDPFEFGLLCYDVWEKREPLYNADGELVDPGYEAGERYGIRYEEALALEAAYQRRRLERIEQRLAQ
ncbi:hypothetical protein EHS39_11460 [Ensifer sp. MPMI2T]|nr:hypothetical protein EHS39_11460 [Ensifer sp. MPMI2T]